MAPVEESTDDRLGGTGDTGNERGGGREMSEVKVECSERNQERGSTSGDDACGNMKIFNLVLYLNGSL